METGFLECKNLCRYFKRGPQEIRAVDDVNLHIRRGEFLAIVGASGSGKSTLLNLMAGLDSVTSGKLSIEGKDFGDMTERDMSRYRANRIGMIFQMFNLLPHLTALENVELALYFTDCPKNERIDRASEILTSIGLGERLEHHPLDLSGGEQQRVAIARALVKKPDILFADEPTGNLDRENASQIAALLTKLHQSGQTIVMVTHDLALSNGCAERTLKMNYGALTAEDGREYLN